MVETKCPVCGNGQLTYCEGRFDTKYVDRSGLVQPLTLTNVRRLQCNACGEEILDDDSTRQVEDSIRAAAGLLTAGDIRELRLRLGKTQVQMSRFIGVGQKTYCRWESGAFTQSLAFDNYLRVIRGVPGAVAMLISLEKPSGYIAHSDLVEEPEFTFLANVNDLHEPAERFTQLLVSGMLHVRAEPRV
jgi:putative zinc finger/helix-turn-helix YgiT family protein